jgi:hypothetical protein
MQAGILTRFANGFVVFRAKILPLLVTENWHQFSCQPEFHTVFDSTYRIERRITARSGFDDTIQNVLTCVEVDTAPGDSSAETLPHEGHTLS